MVEQKQGNWTGYLAGAILVLALGLLVGLREAPIRNQQQTSPPPETQPAATQVLHTIRYEGQDGRTVLELLQAGHQVEAQTSDLGVMVLSIDGIGGDPDTFWLYYVDGQQAPMAADKYVTKTGQQIEWRYEKF